MCACVRACVRARVCWGALCKRTLALTVSVGIQKRLRRASDLVRTGPGTAGPRETRERLAKPLREHHVDAHDVLGSSPGPWCNLHSSRNRRPDGRTNGIYPTVVRERVRGSRDDERAGSAILWPLPDRKARSVWDWSGFLRTFEQAAEETRRQKFCSRNSFKSTFESFYFRTLLKHFRRQSY